MNHSVKSPPSPPSTDPPGAAWYSPDPWVRFGSWTLAGLVGAFIALSFMFTISGAVIATGTIGVKGAYQTVQNADRGIVKKILVANGDLVQRGQVLIELDDTEARAILVVSRQRLDELEIQTARLQAERDGATSFASPAAIARRSDLPAVKAMIASQRALLQARQNTSAGELDVLRQQIKQQQSLLVGLHARHQAKRREMALARQQLTGIRALFAKGYANRQQLTAAQRDHARLSGDLGGLQADVTRINTAIAEARLNLAQARKRHLKDNSSELRNATAARAELRETIKAHAARLRRMQLRSPLTGYVHGLNVHTVGGVLNPGTAIVQIIPNGKQLIIEARIKPVDIDKISQGQSAMVRLPALDARRTPQLTGKISALSAAQFEDPRQGNYFTVQITLAPDQIARIDKSHRLVPGMPAQVFIETTSRSIMSYFLKPLSDAMGFALRES